MKKRLIFLLLMLATTKISSQELKFDDLISVQRPENTQIKDTSVLDTRALQFNSTEGTYTYMIIRTKENDLDKLPFDDRSLKKTYQNFIRGFNKTTTAAGYVLQDSNLVNYKGFVAYEISYINPQIESMVYKNMVLFLNEYSYIFSYITQVDLKQNEMEIFLSSISINMDKNPSQTIGNSTSYKYGVLAGELVIYLIPIVALFFLIKFLIKRKK